MRLVGIVLLFGLFALLIAGAARLLGGTLVGSVAIGLLAAWALWATLTLVDGGHCD